MKHLLKLKRKGLSKKSQLTLYSKQKANFCQFKFTVALLFLVSAMYAQPTPGGKSWADSFKANGLCWCDSTFDHDLNNINKVSFVINGQKRNIKAICDELKKHPKVRNYRNGDPIYNDIQCGNGPANTAWDEKACPGRVDKGKGGCYEKGPRWDIAWLSSRARFGGNNNNNGNSNNNNNNNGSTTNSRKKTIVVRAKGTSGGEKIRVRVNSNTIATHTLTKWYKEYWSSTSSNGGLNVQYFNDSSNKDVRIDWLSVNGSRRQAERQSYNTAVWQNRSCGGSYSEWMHCNGILGFGNTETGAKSYAFNESISNLETSLSIYPNPSSDDIFNMDITGFEENKKIQVFDLAGRQIKEIVISENAYSLDLSSYQGLFLARVSDGQKTEIKKIMKN